MIVSTDYRSSKVFQAFKTQDVDATLAEMNRVRREDIRAVVMQIPLTSVPDFMKFLHRNRPILKTKFLHYHTWCLWMLKCHHNTLKSLPREERETLTKPWRLTHQQKKQVLNCCNAIRKLREQSNFFRIQLELRRQQKEASRSSAADGPKRRGLLFAANNESSDDEEFFGASTVGASESEDNWDELSEIKFGAKEEEDDDDDDDAQEEQDDKTNSKMQRSVQAGKDGISRNL
ncbi:Small-subunit processome Utp12 [Trinorchestia longiramus]|nr:Small-subunit processome Utp12 [Trinorchestia longiramus]